MEILMHPTYLPNIQHMAEIYNADSVLFEKWDNFQKQTLRNRSYIYGPNGKLQLVVPVHYTQKDRQYYKDVKIAYEEDWRLNHKRAIKTAYNTSPFFEFYAEEILSIFELKETFLYDLNIKCAELFLELLDDQTTFKYSTNFEKNSSGFKDLRNEVNDKNCEETKCPVYNQVFGQRHGFIPNLSFIDLLCNEGPQSSLYLKQLV